MGVANIQKSSDFRSCSNQHYRGQASDVIKLNGEFEFFSNTCDLKLSHQQVARQFGRRTQNHQHMQPQMDECGS
jgi:hypothetical protein